MTRHGERAAERRRFPTPTVSGNYNRPAAGTNSGTGLATAVRFPTPTCIDDGARFNRSPSAGASTRPTLGAMAKHGMWPTPTTQDGKNNGSGSQQARNTLPLNALVARKPAERAPDSAMQLQLLSHFVAWVADGFPAGPRLLNPDWVEWLMGWPVGWTDLMAESVTTHPLNIEPDVSRVTGRRKLRAQRLRQTGNGQVPHCARAAFALLCARMLEDA